MRTTRWMGGMAATVAAVAALAVGSGTALADTPAPTPTAGTNQQVCTQRIPKLLTRIDALTARINGDVTTKGSTAWLTDKETKARAAGRTALADLIAVRVSHRTERLAELAHAKTEVLAVQSKDCGS